MAEIPVNLKYANTHEWVRIEDDGTATVGISDYAQSTLGDITFVQLPAVGASLGAGDTFGAIESVKAASDLYSPIAGRVIVINDKLHAQPEIINRSPYGEGWLLKLVITSQPTGLLSHLEYYERTR